MSKTLGNTDKDTTTDNVKDVVFWGDSDCFKLIGKASSKEEGWMKSTKGMEIPNMGVVVQVTTQQGNSVAEALTYIPGARMMDIKDAQGNISRRRIIAPGSVQSNKYTVT